VDVNSLYCLIKIIRHFVKFFKRDKQASAKIYSISRVFNPDFKVVEFDHFKAQAGLPTFTLSAKQWIEKTGIAAE